MTPLRAAVVGVGHLGRHHARILAGLEGVRLVAVVDADEARGRDIAGKYGCRWQPDSDGLERQIDCAVIATPTVFHRATAAPLLRSGIACLVEKPLAPDPETGRVILADAAAGGALLGTGHVERFNPAVRRALELGIEPRFIEAHRLAPYTFRSTDVGVVLDLMIHDLDLVLAWGRRAVESVDAVGGRVLSETEDIVSARLRLAGGVVANLTASRLSLQPMRRFRVFGPDCYVSVDSQQRYALLVRKRPGMTLDEVRAAAKTSDPVAAYKNFLQVEELQLDEDEPLRAELSAFLAAVRAGGRAPVSGEDGLAALELAQRVLDALRGCVWEAGRGA